MNDSAPTADAGTINRGATAKRIGLSILFMFAMRVVEMVVGVVILFELGFALITKRRPKARVVAFANRVVVYGYEIGRYLTYNSDEPPFPFAAFPGGDGPVSSEDAEPVAG